MKRRLLKIIVTTLSALAIILHIYVHLTQVDFESIMESRRLQIQSYCVDKGRRHKLYIFEIINSGCHLSYNFLHFEINLHLSYIIVNSGCYMLYNSIFSKINIHLLYQQIQNSIRFQSLDRFVDGDWTTIGPNHEPELLRFQSSVRLSEVWLG